MRTIAKRTPKEARAAKVSPTQTTPAPAPDAAADLEKARLDAERIVASALIAREYGLATVGPQGIAGRTNAQREEWRRDPITMRLAGFFCEKLAAVRERVVFLQDRDGTRDETRRMLAIEQAKADAYAMVLDAIRGA